VDVFLKKNRNDCVANIRYARNYRLQKKRIVYFYTNSRFLNGWFYQYAHKQAFYTANLTIISKNVGRATGVFVTKSNYIHEHLSMHWRLYSLVPKLKRKAYMRRRELQKPLTEVDCPLRRLRITSHSCSKMPRSFLIRKLLAISDDEDEDQTEVKKERG
jgi:hypothetical protein